MVGRNEQIHFYLVYMTRKKSVSFNEFQKGTAMKITKCRIMISKGRNYDCYDDFILLFEVRFPRKKEY